MDSPLPRDRLTFFISLEGPELYIEREKDFAPVSSRWR
jgi:hypothetical protein